MFTGIVENLSPILSVEEGEGVLRITLSRPENFDDIKIGDSIAVNGICLTVEKLSDSVLQFALGLETLKVTGWSPAQLKGKVMNLERSLRVGDRVHGHLVTGHVDTLGVVQGAQYIGENFSLTIGFESPFSYYIWPKGSVTINGVSLTINEVVENSFQVGLIPETIKVTNLSQLKENDFVNIEVDNWARGLVNYLNTVPKGVLK